MLNSNMHCGTNVYIDEMECHTEESNLADIEVKGRNWSKKIFFREKPRFFILRA